MGRLKWDETGRRFYETGVDHAVLYLIDNNGAYRNGIAWNGITAITESPSGADANPLYADNIKYLNLIAAEDFGATIEAYTYPEEFAVCDGTASAIPGLMLGQQARKMFGLSYRTKVGNDVDGQDHGYKLHLIYGALASPSERGYQTVNDSPEAISFSWTVTTTPVDIPGFKPTACITIDSTKTDPEVLSMIEDIIFGKDEVAGTILVDPEDAIDPVLPSPETLLRMIEAGTPYEETLEMLLDDQGNQIIDSENSEIQVRRMILSV